VSGVELAGDVGMGLAVAHEQESHGKVPRQFWMMDLVRC
jgi:hypothetical protein